MVYLRILTFSVRENTKTKTTTPSGESVLIVNFNVKVALM